jgi:hypothetical protein
MNELFAQLFGQSPSYANALFGEDEAARLRQQAQQQGLMNVGLSLLAGSGPSTQRRGVGQLLAQGVAAGQQAYQGAYNRALQEQAMKEQIAERQQLRQEQQAAQALLPQILRPGAQTPTFYGQPTQRSLRDDEGNIMPGAGVSVGQPQIDMNTLQRLLTQAPSVAGKVLPTIEAFRKLNAPERIKLGAEETLTEITPEGQARVVATGAGKTEKPAGEVLEAMQVLGINVPVSQLSTQQRSQIQNYIIERKRAGATQVNVGEGQKGLENEMKLASAFKGEPVYKAFDEMRASFQQITTGLNEKSPAGDLTAATKFMKLLDPGSVVRESELLLAMQATGALDRFTDVAKKIIDGTKLTGQQRADFRNVAEQLYNAAATSYNTKRDEYLQFGQSQGLKGSILLGQPAKIVGQQTQAPRMPTQKEIDDELKSRGGGI